MSRWFPKGHNGQVERSYDAHGNWTETDYDLAGQATATRSYAAGGTLLSTTSTTYNANGQVATTTDALGNITHNYYDLAGRAVRTISPDGTSSETLYDAAGRAYLSTDRHVPGQAARSTRTTYDLAGRVTASERTDYSYDTPDHSLTVAARVMRGRIAATRDPRPLHSPLGTRHSPTRKCPRCAFGRAASGVQCPWQGSPWPKGNVDACR